MKSLKPVLIAAVLVMTLLASGMASADGYHRGGGHYGYHYRGGHYGGHWGGGHYGHYYRGGHYGSYWSGVRVGIGWPFWGPSWYSPYYNPYYYPPAVAVPSTPPAYIEQAQPEPSSAPSDVWYYCPDSRTYYPYVKECPGGWQTVPAQPPSGP